MTSVPYKCEEWESLCSRFPDALLKCWNLDECEEWDEFPQELPDHVFDCPNGVRVVVTREWKQKAHAKLQWMHIMACIPPEGCLLERLKHSRQPSRRFVEEVERAFFLISPLAEWEIGHPIFWSNTGVPHWGIPL
jgi:hypothetical protein